MEVESKPKIAVVGAGPAGLTLARILHLHGISATVFERESFSTVRHQGGSLDMHPESGQFAIECAGLTREFQDIARYQDQESRVYNKHGELLFLDTEVMGKNRPEVDRGQLRQMLLESVPANLIRWNHDLQAVEPRADGAFDLVFRNADAHRFDLVVGADGAWSRVRPLLSSARPIYSGITFVELGIDDVDARYPHISSLIGRGLTFAVGDRKAIIGHRDASAHVGIYAALAVEEDWATAGSLDTSSSDAMRRSLAAHFNDWSPALLELILRCGDRMTPRGIYALRVGHRWDRRPGVTLLGDAAHLMSPFGGDGANFAMQDAAELAIALIQDRDWKAAVQRTELAMLERAEGPAEAAGTAIAEAFSDDGLAHTLQQMESQRG
jgi:2-polyprenyl-6-methoxyphenol hydroxylase-like FAD-dependent oxidoreductase